MKILMVGLGGIGQRHVRNLRTLMGTNVDIIAYRYRNNPQVLTNHLEIEAGSDLIDKYSIKVYTTLNDAMNQRPDVVFICNPSSLHIPVALQAAQAGYSLFIEKPLSHTMEDVEELINLVESRNIKATVGYQLRFHPCLIHLHSLLHEKVVGKVISVRAEVGEYLPGWHTYEDYRQLYASKSELGGGVILTQIHELDYLYWLFGFPKRIFAMGGHLSSLEVDVEDNADILMECIVENQATPVSIHMDYVQRPPVRICEVLGDYGKIIVNFREFAINVFGRSGEQIENISYEKLGRNQLCLNQMKHFIEYLRGNSKPLLTLREAANSLKMALAAKESLQTGKAIDL